MKKVAYLESARFGIEPGGADPHVQLGVRVREFAANGTLEPGIVDRGAQLGWLGGRRDDETLDEEVCRVVPLVFLLLLQPQLARGRQVALQLGERDTAASVMVATSATAGADDERGEEQQADKRACPVATG